MITGAQRLWLSRCWWFRSECCSLSTCFNGGVPGGTFRERPALALAYCKTHLGTGDDRTAVGPLGSDHGGAGISRIVRRAAAGRRLCHGVTERTFDLRGEHHGPDGV